MRPWSEQGVIGGPEVHGIDGFDGPALLWNPEILTNDGMFGLQSGRFGFTLKGTPDIVVTVEASSDLTTPLWKPVATLFLNPAGTAAFKDPATAAYRSRFYRLRRD